MKPGIMYMAIVALLGGFVVPPAHAQKGMGDSTGMAQKAVKPEIVSFSGKILEVKTEPCKKTTGRASIGTHFLLETAEAKKLNIHLGPADVDVVADIAKKLKAGEQVAVKCFHTTKMEENHYVARLLVIGDESIQLRDEYLRPVWAGSRALGNRGGPRWGSGKGRGHSWGRGKGYGRRLGHGPKGRRGAGYGSRHGRGRAFMDE